MPRKVLLAVAALVLLPLTALIAFIAYSWATNLDPRPVELAELSCDPTAPPLRPGQELSVMSWNVQYMASKNYTFFYDLMDGSGPDTRPSREHIEQTLREVARVIVEEDPDVILLQEVDEGAGRTDLEDQTARLLELLPDDYVCRAEAFYWRADFVPDPNIMGPVGMKLVTLSRHRIDGATRVALAEVPKDPVTQLFFLKRAVLSTTLAVAGSSKGFAVLNTHLAAFAQGDDTMQRQVDQVAALTASREQTHRGWVAGGDFNLLAPPSSLEAGPNPSFGRLSAGEQAYYNPTTELLTMYAAGHQSVPPLELINGPEAEEAHTFFPNNRAEGPDRTLDYIFMPKSMRLVDGHVRRGDTLAISDHLPVVAKVVVP